jgi:hypothetical protein
MGVFRLFSRVAFICNICFVIALILQQTRPAEQVEMVSVIMIMGLVLAFIMNLISGFGYLVLRWTGKLHNQHIPGWITLINLIFLILQLALLLK